MDIDISNTDGKLVCSYSMIPPITLPPSSFTEILQSLQISKTVPLENTRKSGEERLRADSHHAKLDIPPYSRDK